MDMKDIAAYKDKQVFITGHTGFKGTWICHVLSYIGASVTGYALPDSPTGPSLFQSTNIGSKINDIRGDIRDFPALKKAFDEAKPEIAIHLAAQPIVKRGYAEPLLTYETNVLGTANLMECIRLHEMPISVLNVTTDKVYRNDRHGHACLESDVLDGFDPYSNSKSCSELVTGCYKRALFGKNVTVSTVRAGNVIGGGDFADNRIIPDCVRAALSGKPIHIRNPSSVRPYQHVLNAIDAYLTVIARQIRDPATAGSYNIGPDQSDHVTTEQLVKMFADAWGPEFEYEIKPEIDAPHEDDTLELDCGLIRNKLGWSPTWNIKDAIGMTVQFTKAWQEKRNTSDEINKEIREFFQERR